MAGPLEPVDPSQLRISDEDRHRVSELLRDAAGEGRIDLVELDERLERAYAAKTYADLVPLTIDLPAHPTSATSTPVQPNGREVAPPAASHGSSTAIMGDCTRRGPWLVSERHTAFSIMGSVTLDLREATFVTGEVTIMANAVMAGIEVVVDARTHVVVEGIGIMGDFSQGRDKVAAEIGPGSPVVRVKGLALMGSVSVVRKGPPSIGRRSLRPR